MNSPPMNLPIAIAAIIGKHAGMLLERLPFVIMIFASGLVWSHALRPLVMERSLGKANTAWVPISKREVE